MAKNVIKGVDVAALEEVISEFSSDPNSAKFDFRSATDWQGGAVVNSSFTGHKRNGVDDARATLGIPLAFTATSFYSTGNKPLPENME